jgi:hypothetical protein
MRKVVCLVAMTIFVVSAFVVSARAETVIETIQNFGMMGIWATDCADMIASKPRFFRAILSQAGAEVGYTTLSNDVGIKTTVRSVVRATERIPPNRLKFTFRIVGGDRDGMPLPSPPTNTFEQTFEKRAGDVMEMAGNPPIFLQRCRD